MSWEFLPGAAAGAVMSGIGALLSWRIASAKTEAADDKDLHQLKDEGRGLRQDIRDLRQELRDGASELRSLNAMLLKLQASQDVVNVMNSKALESLALKQVAHAEAISDHAATLKILSQLLQKKGLLE